MSLSPQNGPSQPIAFQLRQARWRGSFDAAPQRQTSGEQSSMQPKAITFVVALATSTLFVALIAGGILLSNYNRAEAQAAKSKPPAGPSKKAPVADPEAAAAALTAGAGLTAGTLLCFAVVGVIAFIMWLMPIVIAFARGHPDTVAIVCVCFFFGWTFIGWAIAFIWSVKHFQPPQALNISVGNVGQTATPQDVRIQDVGDRNPFDFG
jgi:Superinfection immunity protein